MHFLCIAGLIEISTLNNKWPWLFILQVVVYKLNLFRFYSERFKYFQSLLSHFFHVRCSVHVHACLFFPSQLAFSTVPPWHLPASNQLTQLTNGLQVAGSSMSTHFDFFLSVYVHWAKKELRGFTSSQDSCVPYSCVVHLRLRIKSLLFR